MLRSRIVPAFLCVALAHAALIGAFFTAEHAPAPRPIHSSAIVARLLGPDPQPATTAAAGRRVVAPAMTNPGHANARADAHADPRPSPHTHPTQPSQSSSASPPALASRATLPSTTAPSQPAPPALSASNPPMPATVSDSANANANANTKATSTSQSPANDTIAVAAPKHVERADCHIVKPAYPALSRRRGEAGTATVRFVIGTTGALDSVTLAKSSGFPRLDDAALEALRESTCAPYVENGSPMRASYEQAFKFGLEDD